MLRTDVDLYHNILIAVTPTPPVSRYRNRGCEHPYQVAGLRELLQKYLIPPFCGKLQLLILHIISYEKDARRIPDFDNFDCKSLIDEILRPFGGDHPYGMILIHAAEPESQLAPGTYLAVQPVDDALSIEACKQLFFQSFVLGEKNTAPHLESHNDKNTANKVKKAEDSLFIF